MKRVAPVAPPRRRSASTARGVEAHRAARAARVCGPAAAGGPWAAPGRAARASGARASSASCSSRRSPAQPARAARRRSRRTGRRAPAAATAGPRRRPRRARPARGSARRATSRRRRCGGGQEQQVALRPAAQQDGAQQRAAREIEGAGGLRGGPAARSSPSRAARREGAEVDARHEGERGGLRGGSGTLERLSAGEDEAGAQHLVTAQDLAEAPGERRRIEAPRDVERRRQVQVRARRARAAPGTRAAAGRRTEAAAASRGARRHDAEPGPRSRRRAPRSGRPGRATVGVSKTRAAAAPPRTPRAPARPPGSPAASGRRGRRSRPPAPPARRPSTSAQIAGSMLLDRLARRRARRSAGAPRPRPAQEGERLAVDLAVGGQRQGAQEHAGGRHHVVRQPLAQEGAQLGRLAAVAHRVRRGHHVGHQPRVPRPSSRAPATTASRTAGWAASAASISPSSMRKPRTLTWWSSRPRNSSVPVRPPAHQVAGAVEPRRPAPPPNGSGRKRSAVRSGRPR